ncbi:hypothetical protein D3C80_1631100 [compost metagenome]
MPQLAGEAGCTFVQLLIQNDSSTDTDAYADIDLIRNTLSSPVFLFALRAGIGFVIDGNRHTEALLQLLLKRDFAPF